jgi:hypothetical protein
MCVLEQLEKSGAVFDHQHVGWQTPVSGVLFICSACAERGQRPAECEKAFRPLCFAVGEVELLVLEAWDQIVPSWLVRMKHIRLQSDEEYDFSSFYKKRNCYNAVMGVRMCCLHRKNHEVWRFIHPQIFLSIAQMVWDTRNDKAWKL